MENICMQLILAFLKAIVICEEEHIDMCEKLQIT